MTYTHENDEYGLRKGAEEFPMMIVLSFVYVCNARCPNCPYNNSNIREKYKNALYMPAPLFKQIADECGPYKSYLRISGGGEPMLHPQATELMLYAKAQNCKLGIISNGSRYTDENLSDLIQANVDVLEFSVDAGDEQTYNTVRPGLDWNRLNDTIDRAVAIRDKTNAKTRIVTSIINQTGVDVDHAEAYWAKKVDKVQIRKYLTWGYNKNESADDTPYLPPEKRVPCPWLFERLNIDSLGNVTLCGEDIAFDNILGNLNKASIKDIWLGPEFERLRKLHLSGRGSEVPICSQCPDWQYRSWNYNYWKVIRDAEGKRQDKDSKTE